MVNCMFFLYCLSLFSYIASVPYKLPIQLLYIILWLICWLHFKPGINNIWIIFCFALLFFLALLKYCQFIANCRQFIFSQCLQSSLWVIVEWNNLTLLRNLLALVVQGQSLQNHFMVIHKTDQESYYNDF